MERDNNEERYVPLSGLQMDVLDKLVEILATKNIDPTIFALIASIPALWDENGVKINCGDVVPEEFA